MDRISRLRSSIRFEQTEIIVVKERDGGSRLWSVADRHGEGWLFEPLNSKGERHLFLHDDVHRLYVEGRIKILGRPARVLDGEEELRVRRAWEGAPAALRAIAERRFLLLRACIEQRGQYRSMAECFRTVPGEIVSRMGAVWEVENRKLQPATTAAAGPSPPAALSAPDRLSPHWVPCERSMWNFYALCGNARADVRRLLPRDHLKGDSRPLFSQPLIDLMDEVISEELLKPPVKTVTYGYELFKGRARQRLGITAPIVPDRPVSNAPSEPIEAAGDDQSSTTADRLPRRMNDFPSYATFYRRTVKLRPDAKVRGHSGQRQATLDFGTFNEATPPSFMLNQVEVDHSFINMFVKDDVTGRLLGRPWLTAIRERKTKVILGLHVSFLPPSWMTLSRAVAHAIWPKDLSEHSGLVNGWDYHGVFDWLVTDRGLEFLGDGLRLSGRILGFEIGNLQGFSPWLKGGLERLFRTMKGQVFSYREGTSAWRALKHYDGRASTQMTLGQLKSELVAWVTDTYHRREHASIGMSPDDRWLLELASHGPPRGVADFQDLRRLFCRTEIRSIQNLGVEYDGLLFNSPILADLRGRGGDNAFEIMIDPYDLRSIFLQDPQAGVTQDTWIEVPCTRPELAVNVTQHQHELHKALARLSAPGEVITEAMLLRARERADGFLIDEANARRTTGTAARLARYRDSGSFLTPVRLAGAPIALKIEKTVDWGQKILDPVTGSPIGEQSEALAAQLKAASVAGDPNDTEDARTPLPDSSYESAILEATAMLKRV